ncbi:MAG: endonuclease/exonuclease/phosphatase family protein [Desulfosalsimonadaceae bacterium]
MKHPEHPGNIRFYKFDPFSDKVYTPHKSFSDADCRPRQKSSSLTSSRTIPLLLMFFILCFQIVLVFTGCSSVPENAPLTIPNGYDSLAGEFVEEASFPHQEMQYLTFEEIESLAMDPHPEGPLQDKLSRFWETPIISNAAWYRGVRPRRPSNAYLGDYLRIGTWNIENSLHLDLIGKLLASEETYRQYLDGPFPKRQKTEYLRQRERLASADVLVLQEIDIGVPRSDYIHGPEYLAQTLGMNYAYAPQALELGPVLTELELDRIRDIQLPEEQQPDTELYRGVFGSLVLSKYPIKSAECFQLKLQPYDWYEAELAEYDAIEGIRKFGSKSFFHNEIRREAKIGGRNFFRVDIEVPGLPKDTLTVINIHLEIKAQPEERAQQIREILDYIGEIENPVVLAGDFNSSRYDMSPTSLPRVTSRLARDANFWIDVGINLFSPAYSVYNTGRFILNEGKDLHNPVAINIPVALPNKALELFTEIREYRFQDGGRFDFRGDREHSINQRDAKLSNSNEKAFYGYRPTFSVKRPIGPFGRNRLDWIFVKSGFYTDEKDSYRLAPHFGETLSAFHEAMPEFLSDHRPNIIDLPLQNPPVP